MPTHGSGSGPHPRGPHRWEDFLALEEDDLRELVDGHFLEIEVPNEFHEWIVTWRVTNLTVWAHPRGMERQRAST